MSTIKRSGATLSKFELPARADALIAAQPRCPDRPFFREATFTSKLRRRVLTPGPIPIDPAFALIIEAEWRAILENAKLSDAEFEVVWLVSRGFSLNSIASRQGITRQAVHQRFRRIREKIGRAEAVYPYAGLAEVYRSEVCRGVLRGVRRGLP